MHNFDLIVTTKSGASSALRFENGSDAIAWLAGYGDEEVTRLLRIEAISDDGRKIRITIPNSSSMRVKVEIDDPDGELTDPVAGE